MPATRSTKPPAPDRKDPVATVTHAELLECARLLAVSLAHHRAKLGVIPIAHSAASLGAREAAGAKGLRAEAMTAFHEALALVRRQAEGRRAPTHSPASLLDDKRHHMRISVSAPIQVSFEPGGPTRHATLQNISWGGAQIHSREPLGEVGGRLCLHLPADRQSGIEVLATILRTIPDADGAGCEYGLRFESLSPRDEERLQRVLGLLVSSPGPVGRRAEARLVQRLEVEYGDAGELRATLQDISASGLQLIVPDPFEIDQSLLVSLSSTEAGTGLTLRARVVHQTLMAASGMEMYRVGLQFEHPTPQLRERIEAVLRELATLRPQRAEAPVPTDAGHRPARSA